MKLLREKDGHVDIRLIVLVFVVLSGIAAALLFYPPITTRTAEERSSGDVTFIDRTGNPLGGTLEISGAGISSGEKSNVNFISWSNIPNARIGYNALDIKNISLDLRISGNSPKSIVILENYGINMPDGVNVSAPGIPVKYLEISSVNLSIVEAKISVQYSDAELNGIDENNLTIYHYDREAEAWNELPAAIDGNNNTLNTTVESLSFFAVSTKVPGTIEIRDSRKKRVVSDVKIYDEARVLKMGGKTSTLTAADIPDTGELEVDAVQSKNVKVSLKIDKQSSGEIILDDYGKKNPVPVPPPARVVKFVEIGARNISFSSAEVTIHYSDAELNGMNESTLAVYHWEGAKWDMLETTRDDINNILSANTTLLSPFAIAGQVEMTGITHPGGNISDCASCHINVSGGSTQSMVDTAAIKQGIHKDLNSNATNTSVIDPINKACWACHTNGTEYNTTIIATGCLACHNSTANLTYTDAGRIADLTYKKVYNHIQKPYAASLYSDALDAGVNCTACHNKSISVFNDTGAANATIDSNISHYATIDRLPYTTDCLYCHNQPNLTIRNSWGNASQVNGTNMFGNWYDTSKNESCYICHTIAGSKPSDFHSSELVVGGGPGCLGCHNTSTPQNYTGMHYIDGGNFSIAIHGGMNAANGSSTGYGINASCWACHSSNGSYVANSTHPDRTTTPYNCNECHLAGGNRTGAYDATVIYNHYRNGTAITALSNKSSDLASCIECHENVSGMIIPNNDQDTGSFTGDGIGATGGPNSSYHYGANRSNFNRAPGSFGYCAYCHGNDTGEFNTTFQDPANRNISNHSVMYNSSNPTCSDAACHNSSNSSLHGIELSMPVIALPNSSYCLGCHGNNGTGYPVYNGSITGYKEKHNNTVECTQCHLDTGKSIHPAQYLQKDLTWNTSNASAVTCTACHQGAGIGGFDNAPKVSTVQHSAKPTNGSIWNKTNPYWINTSQQSMCDYCHGDSRHKASALGRPANWNGINTINPTITNESNWCSGCHYQGYSSGGKNYTNMVSTFSGNNLTVPPEITNSTYAPGGVSGYYNHSLTPDYNDSTCKGCHGNASSTKIGEVLHVLSTGTCKDCHFSFEFMNSSGTPTLYVNQSMYNNSPHGSLECEDCHTKGHNNIGARKSCEDCHAVSQNPKNSTERHNITGDPRNYSIPGIGPVLNITDCTACHDSNLYNNATASYGLPPKPMNCDYCHTYPDSTYA